MNVIEVSFGQYAVPVILTVVLQVVFNFFPVIADRWKSIIAISFGIALGLVAIPYNALPWTVVNIVDHAIYGFMLGASAVGIYELQRAVRKPRNGNGGPVAQPAQPAP